MRTVIVFILACICLVAMTWLLVREITMRDVQYMCDRLGLIEINGKAYDCEPKPPVTWEESEDFK